MSDLESRFLWLERQASRLESEKRMIRNPSIMYPELAQITMDIEARKRIAERVHEYPHITQLGTDG